MWITKDIYNTVFCKLPDVTTNYFPGKITATTQLAFLDHFKHVSVL